MMVMITITVTMMRITMFEEDFKPYFILATMGVELTFEAYECEQHNNDNGNH